MAQKDTTSVETIIQNINNKQYAPIYYLMGEESYYINKISDYIASHVLSEEEKGFNQIMLYGNETNIETIITAAKRFPMMSQYQVIIVKEAQNLNNIDKLSYYIQKPQLSTILVFCHMNGTLDRRKKITLEIGEKGVLFESKKLKEYHEKGRSICGDLMSRAITYAMAVLEVNASMGVIVAAPTAGSSGVVPGVLLALQEEYDLPDEEILNGLYTAGAVGYLLMRNASVAGAEAGCPLR